MKTRTHFDNQTAVTLRPSASKRPRHNRHHASAVRKFVAIFVAALVASSTLLVSVKAADGNPDATFGVGGRVITDYSGKFDAASDVAIQSDGKIVVAGEVDHFTPNGDFLVARYDTNGNPDPTFGIGGKVTTDFSGDDAAFGVAIQPDGKIVAVGATYGAGYFAIARYDTNGNPDLTFGLGGKTISTFAGVAVSVLIQSDGKILVGGFGYVAGGSVDFGLMRFESNGSPDLTFGSGGQVLTDFFGGDDGIFGLALQSDGKIVAAGKATPLGEVNHDFAIARYNTDGTPDLAFGNFGKTTTDFAGEEDLGTKPLVQSDGTIIVVGDTVNNSCGGPCRVFGLVRYDSAGVIDPAFGVGGKVTTDVVGFLNDAVQQCDDKIVVAGTAFNGTARDVALVRLLNDGSLDPTFGIGGKIVTDFQGFNDGGQGIAIQNDGRIVVAGGTEANADTDSYDFLVARYDNETCASAYACPNPQGYWKNNPNAWPVNSLTLGGKSYTKAELLALLKTSTQTDASLILARQLIAAKLNIASGSDPAPASDTIVHADGLLTGFSGKLPYKVKPSSVGGQSMVQDGNLLNSYNNSLLTPGCTP